jgi:hypothetical protein
MKMDLGEKVWSGVDRIGLVSLRRGTNEELL